MSVKYAGPCASCVHAEHWHTPKGCYAFKCTCKAYTPPTAPSGADVAPSTGVGD